MSILNSNNSSTELLEFFVIIGCTTRCGLAYGCPNNVYDKPGAPENDSPSQKAAVRCCSNYDEICITPLPCFILTYGEAKEKCAAIGRRLCMAEELAKEKCCGSNNTVCNFDTALTWHSTEDVYTCTTCTLDEVFVPDKRIEQKEQAEKARLEYTANFKAMDLVKIYPKMLELLW